MTGMMPHCDQQYRANGHVNGNEHAHVPAAGPLTAIPTDDPAAALQFCRALAQALVAAPAPVAAGLGVEHPADLSATTRPALSVVIPVYNEEDNLPQLFERLTVVLEATNLAYEIVFVDDGS